MTYAAQALAAARDYGLDIPDDVDDADRLLAAVNHAAHGNPPPAPHLPARADQLAAVLGNHGEDVRAQHAAQQAALTMQAPAQRRLAEAVHDAAPAWIDHLARDYDTTIKKFAGKARSIPDNAREERLAELNPTQFAAWQQARTHAHTLDHITRTRDLIARAAGEGGIPDKGLFVAASVPEDSKPADWPGIAEHITRWRDHKADPVRRWAALTASPLTLALAPVGAPLNRSQAREQCRDDYINRNRPKRRR